MAIPEISESTPYSSHLSELGCNAGTWTYVPPGATGPLALACGNAAMAVLTGLGSITVSLKEMGRLVEDLTHKRGNALLLIFKINAYFHWFVNGGVSILGHRSYGHSTFENAQFLRQIRPHLGGHCGRQPPPRRYKKPACHPLH